MENEREIELVTGGTENHIVLMNAFKTFGIGGKQAQDTLESAGMSANRNTIPQETRSPFDPSGIRLGTPAMTTRGFGMEQFEETAAWIAEVLRNPSDAELVLAIREKVRRLCSGFPVPSSGQR